MGDGEEREGVGGADSTHRARRALMEDLSSLHLKRKDKKAFRIKEQM